ncbi:MAG: nucleoside monophosphate kinase [Treponema sp.]|nr:nucleoside monophosphate kinase [Treponema sp.]
MKMIFMGPPGAGKGTLAAKVGEMFKILPISTGAIFRSAMSSGSALGLKIKAIVESGGLVDDQTTVQLVKERLAQADVQKGYILDGFPRTIPQAEELAKFSAVERVLNIRISDADVMERLGGRQVCRTCGYNFHVIFDKVAKEGVCDHCGGEVYTRNDDKPDAILKRLDVYREQTAPLIGYYREKGVLYEMQAMVKFDDTMESFKKSMGL